jgi:hypothetical protein
MAAPHPTWCGRDGLRGQPRASRRTKLLAASSHAPTEVRNRPTVRNFAVELFALHPHVPDARAGGRHHVRRRAALRR